MSDKLDEIELRSEEVQEVLSQIPNWMIRWGSTLVLSLIFFIIFISWMVKYPDILVNETVITTSIPPQKEYAQITGKIDSIYVEGSEIVKKDKVLAVIQNSAITEDVYLLKSILDTLEIKDRIIEFPINKMPILLLGEIESAYASFENNYTNYLLNRSLQPFNNESKANEVSINELSLRLSNMQYQYSLNLSGLDLERKNLQRHKELLEKGVISQLDYEGKQLVIFNAEKSLKNLGLTISQTRESIANATKNSKGTEIIQTTEESKLLRNSLHSFNQLKKAVSDWEDKYVFKSDINGKVAILNYWSSNQTVNQGDLVFTVIPLKNRSHIAKIKAIALNSGKIKLGQKVNIRLKNYPETEFGMLNGNVSNISLIPDESGYYIVDVNLPIRLTTSYNKEIEFKHEMSGSAEIITEDIRLLQRIFYQFKELFNN